MQYQYSKFNNHQRYTIDSIVSLIEKKDPVFVNVQGQGGSGKSFIIN